ncbi:hypothetical protein WMW72_00555 [Paenibacillus filicis]|uniref:Uncharacterized protein n=1 Tax=Paenibacillus filicis TaxID=669464 RepID=A0ABU9DC30_9BACL
MTKQVWRAALCAALMIVAAGCGQVKPGTEAGSFAEAGKGTAEPTSKPAAGQQSAAGSTSQAVADQSAAAGTSSAVSAGPEKKAEAPEAAKPSETSSAPANQAPAGGAAEQPPAAQTADRVASPQTASSQAGGSTAPQGAPPAAAPAAESTTPPATAAVKAPEQAAAPQSGQTPPAVKAEAPAAGQGAKAESGPPKIKWQDFFDDDKQNRPAEKFWDLSEQHKTVQINGYMGEVLSFDKHWFLLIPQPGAECPFDNGDETYWNKIMMVFVPDDVKLRYTSGPLKITGRLDVGIKVDESGYKTMFRLYDAKFEPIKE